MSIAVVRFGLMIEILHPKPQRVDAYDPYIKIDDKSLKTVDDVM